MPPSQLTRKELKDRLDLLEEVKKRVEGRLKQSLHHAVLIDLCMNEQPKDVRRPWDVDLKVVNQPSVQLPQGTEIIDVFDRTAIAGKLLILGAPGSGKTTTLLELANDLIARAKDDVDKPIPVLFNLSSWKEDKQHIADWLVTELMSTYGIPKAISKQWLKNRQLLPLLDGLDELESSRQQKCVLAINQFLESEQGSRSLVVCSRQQEYDLYKTKLHLNGSICLQPLTEAQIQKYLEDVGRVDLWQSIQDSMIWVLPNQGGILSRALPRGMGSDSGLFELAKSPLLLSIMILAYKNKNISIEELQKRNSPKARRQYLFDAYIERMLKRDINNLWYGKGKEPDSVQTKAWLTWIAKMLKKDSQTEFLIERMQPYWLPNRVSEWSYLGLFISIFILSVPLNFLIIGLLNPVTYNIIPRLVFLYIFVIFEIIIIELFTMGILLVKWALNWLIFLISRFIGRSKSKVSVYNFIDTSVFYNKIYKKILNLKIEPVESLKWSWPKAKSTLASDLRRGNNMIKSIPQNFHDPQNLLDFLIVVSVVGIVVLVVVEFGPSIILVGVIFFIIFIIFNIFIIFSVSLIIGIFHAFISGLVGPEIETRMIPNQGIQQSARNAMLFVLISVLSGLANRLTGNWIWPLFGGFIITSYWLLGGGFACIQHLALRLVLWSNGCIPWNYARFLNYATERMFLQKVGGRYLFIHDFLREHFSDMKPD